MLGVLIKKQLAEVFRSYFYDAKKNRMRSKWAIAGYILFFLAVMVGMLGGMFTYLALSLCGGLTEAGMGWLYYLLMSVAAVFLGAFGSVFNTYAGLYLGKDNDLLLSLPIPVATIVDARLTNVYLLGTMYAATALLPTLIVGWIVAGATAARVICGVVFFLTVTLIVLLLSCLLGWVVAKISVRLKNKSLFTVLLSLVFLAAYYFIYFKAAALIRDIVGNAAVYGERIRGASRGLYLFGRIGEGDWLAAALFLLVTAGLFALLRRGLLRSFLGIAAGGGAGKKVRYTEKPVRERSVFGALLGKELGRFVSSPSYMLNCGLGVLLIPAVGAALLIRGREVCALIGELLSGRPDSAAMLLCTALCLLSAMNDMAAPAVSLEGKCLWIPQSLPVEPRQVLRSKTAVQLLLTGVPMLFAGVCAAVIAPAGPAVRLLLCLQPLAYTAFSAVAGTVLGLRMPLLHWTNETAPIKQSGAVTIALLGGWALCLVLAAAYFLVGYRIGAAPYLLAWTIALAAVTLLLQRWLDTKGAAAFAAL